jgi:hypothetical protein
MGFRQRILKQRRGWQILTLKAPPHLLMTQIKLMIQRTWMMMLALSPPAMNRISIMPWIAQHDSLYVCVLSQMLVEGLIF